MTENEVIEKFRGNAKLIISETQAAKLTSLVRNLEGVDNLRSLVGLLVPA
jgi:hypothetical protein